MALRNYSANAVGTTLTAAITTAGQATCTVAATTGFPSVPFIAIIDPDTTAEEVVLVTNVATLTLTITRGYDSTTAVTRLNGAKLQHSFSAIDFREPNTFLNSGGTVGGNTSITGTISATGLAGSLLSSATPLANAVAAAGTSAVPSRDDHVHPAVDTGFNPFLLMGA